VVALPELEPMKAVTADLPREDGGWGYEVKWDGMRVLAYVNDDRPEAAPLRLLSGRGREITNGFPDLADLAAHLAGHRAVLDGEVVAFDEMGRPDFGRLQRRMHVASVAEAQRRAERVAVTYVMFDLLHLDGSDVSGLPYVQRRHLLSELVEATAAWSVPAHQEGDGAALLEAVRGRELEGIMAKRLESTYEPGRRSPAWRKVKVRNRQEVVVGGWTLGSGHRSERPGALLVGVVPNHRVGTGGPITLRYAGKVGTGFTDAELTRLLDRLNGLAADRCPFDPRPPPAISRAARWAHPELVAEVTYGEWTADDHLRHPSYVGLRTDKDPAEVVREPTSGYGGRS